MSKLTLKQIAIWCDGSVQPEFEDVTVEGISTDTRSIASGQLFIALEGPTFDGHNFAGAAIEKGAAAVMTHKTLAPEIPAVTVNDTMRGLGDLARSYRMAQKFRVVGITGSVGKTTTKEMTADILSTTYQTARTSANHNNNIGLPCSIMAVEPEHEIAVLEMGMNHFGEMSYLTAIAKPDIALINNIGTMHIEHLGSREGILQAKLEILEGLQPDGKIIFNGDEPLLWDLRETVKPEPIYFGITNEECQIRAREVHKVEGGMNFIAAGFGEEMETFIPAEGMHNVYDALAAISVGLVCKIKPERIQHALSQFRNTGSRQSIYEISGYTIIEDCYNAGPESMKAALEVLGEHPTSGRRIAVLGDMLELGATSAAEHYRVGRLAAEHAEMVFAYGQHSHRVVSGAVTGGIDTRHTAGFDSHEALIQEVCRAAKPGDVLLFKGSRGMKMEKALELFLQQEREK